MLVQLGSCLKCNGDLIEEYDEWRCLQCGRHYYDEPRAVVEDNIPYKRRPPGGIAGRNINALVHARNLSDDHWWNRNRLVIDYLDEGHNVSEITAMTGLSPRRIREIRQRLYVERNSLFANLMER